MDMQDRPLPLFRSPADQATRDLADQPALLASFAALWNDYLDGFSQQAIVGNPWQVSNSANTPYYYNPLTTPMPAASRAKAIQWSAMPGRIAYYNEADWNSQLSATQINQLADFGWQPDPGAADRQSFPGISNDPCSGLPAPKPFGPYGPRGWMDEYCEWSVQRDPETGKILRIDFTCENPEYWYALWEIAPEQVLALYRSTLGKPNIQADDLCLMDASGNKVLDPSTRRPVYNPLNAWNCGTVQDATTGGAMHLTSTPNTLQTEIVGLAGGATIQRTGNHKAPEDLLCCSQFGQAFRNSDPHIGLLTNLLVAANNQISLSDPPGLYIQTPDFSQYQLPSTAPAGLKPDDFWTVSRGAMTLHDMFGNPLPGNFILHAVYQVPPGLGFTVGDITIGGEPILYGAQIAATFFMQINATPIAIPGPVTALPCAGDLENKTPQPLQMFFTDSWNAYYGAAAPANPVGVPMVVASNTVIVPPSVCAGQSGLNMTLVCVGASRGPNGELPTVVFDGAEGAVVAEVRNMDTVRYTVPGNTYPSPSQALSLSVTVDGSAQPGLRAVTIVNFGKTAGQAAPAFLRVAV